MYNSVDVKTRSKSKAPPGAKKHQGQLSQVKEETPVKNKLKEEKSRTRTKKPASPRKKRGKAKSWTCGKCSTRNPQRSMICKSCEGKLPVIALFKASRRDLKLGHPIRLTWDVIDAERVLINPGQELVENKGVLDVDPDETTEYTITAYNEIGSRQLSTKVTLAPPVIHNFQAAETEVVVGYPTILHWEVENGAELEINMEIGDVSGTTFTEVYLYKPGVCVLTATNKAGSVSAAVPLTMSLPEINAFYPDSETIKPGTPNILNWDVNNAQKVIISPNVGEVTDLTHIDVSPEKTTTYILRAINHIGVVEKKIELVLPPPKVKVFSASSELSTEGEPVELYWEVENAYHVCIDHEIGDVTPFGSVKVKPMQAYTSYTLTAEGFSGKTQKTFMITRFPIPLSDTMVDITDEISLDMDTQEKKIRNMTPDLEQIEKDLRKNAKNHQRKAQIKRVKEMELTDDLLKLEKASVRKEIQKWIKRLKAKLHSNNNS